MAHRAGDHGRRRCFALPRAGSGLRWSPLLAAVCVACARESSPPELDGLSMAMALIDEYCTVRIDRTVLCCAVH